MRQAHVRLAAHQRVPLVWRVKSEYHPHGGGLAGSVRSDKAGDLAWPDHERHAIECHSRPEALAYVGQFNRCLQGRITRSEPKLLFRR
jgi:hypothetical protein